MFQKYLKYKKKYLEMKKLIGGNDVPEILPTPNQMFFFYKGKCYQGYPYEIAKKFSNKEINSKNYDFFEVIPPDFTRFHSKAGTLTQAPIKFRKIDNYELNEIDYFVVANKIFDGNIYTLDSPRFDPNFSNHDLEALKPGQNLKYFNYPRMYIFRIISQVMYFILKNMVRNTFSTNMKYLFKFYYDEPKKK